MSSRIQPHKLIFSNLSKTQENVSAKLNVRRQCFGSSSNSLVLPPWILLNPQYVKKQVPLLSCKSSIVKDFKVTFGDKDKGTLKTLKTLFAALPKVSKSNRILNLTIVIDNPSINTRVFQAFSHFFPQIHRVEKLTLQIMKDAQLIPLMNSLKSCPFQKLVLDVQTCSLKFQLQETKLLFQKMRVLSYQSIDLRLAMLLSKETLDSDMTTLANSLIKIKKIHHLHMQFENGEQFTVSDSTFVSHLQTLQKVVKKGLSVDITRWKHNSEEDIFNLLESEFNPTGSKGIKFNFSGFEVKNPRIFLNIIKSLSNTNHQQTFKINPALYSSFALGYIPNRKNDLNQPSGQVFAFLNLPIAKRWGISSDTIDEFLKNPKLQAFELFGNGSLDKWKLCQPGPGPRTENIKDLIVPHNPNLLRLSFAIYPKADSKLNIHESMHHIPAITLNFVDGLKGTEDAFIQMMDQLTTLSNLEDLTMYWRKCPKMTDNVLRRLAQPLSNLNNLKNLRIKFDSCVSITNEAVLEFSAFADQLPGLQYFSMSIQDCQNISTGHVEKIKEAGRTKIELRAL